MTVTMPAPAELPVAPPPVRAAPRHRRRARRRLRPDVHGHPRQPRHDHRAARPAHRAVGHARAAAVDGERLHAQLRHPDDRRRDPGRPVGTPPGVRRRHRRVRARLDRVRPGHERRDAHRRPRGAGRRRRGDHAAVPHPARRRGPAARRAMAIGIWGGVSGLGVALGPVIGGAVVDGISWEAIFWINVPVAVVAVPLVLWALPESHGRRQPLDLAGLALAGAGILSLVWAIIRGNDDGWGSVTVRRRHAARRPPARRVPAPRVAHRPPADPAAAVPGAVLRGGQRERAGVLVRRLRPRVPARPVPADRHGLHAAGGRHPHAAVDRRAHDLRADRRDARSPRRRPPAARRGARPAGRRTGVAGAHRLHRRARRTPTSCPGSPWPASAWV